jgi:hypothetical protein
MRLKPELKGAVLALAGMATVLIGVWIYLGLRLHIWTYYGYERYVWLTANLPIAHSLWHQEIKPGDDVEKLIRQWRPHTISRFGRFVELRWFPGGPSQDTISFIGIWALAKDGRLTSASSYSDDGVIDRMFFDTLTPKERLEYRAALETYIDKLQAQKQNPVQQNGAANAASPHR